MLVIFDKCTNPYFNLASEEFLLANQAFDETVIRIWQNSPAIIVGKFQNTLAEINADYVKTKNIAVVRRITGGGAVYHDLGNINYSIVQQTSSKNIDFSLFTKPIITLLSEYGIKAENKGRNDIEINGCKISGGAQTIRSNRVLHHGTLLFSADLNVVAQALQVKKHKLQSKGIKSIRARVGNIVDFMAKPICVEQFMNDLQSHFLKQADSKSYSFSVKENEEIQTLLDNKYNTWEWNYGKSPDYNIERSQKYEWGELTIYLLVKNDIIKNIAVYGDFFSTHEVNNSFLQLIDTPFEQSALKDKIRTLKLWTVLPNMTEEELIKQLLP